MLTTSSLLPSFPFLSFPFLCCCFPAAGVLLLQGYSLGVGGGWQGGPAGGEGGGLPAGGEEEEVGAGGVRGAIVGSQLGPCCTMIYM